MTAFAFFLLHNPNAPERRSSLARLLSHIAKRGAPIYIEQ